MKIKIIIISIIYVVILLLSYLLMLPSINLTNVGFYFYLVFLIIIPILIFTTYFFRKKFIERKKKKGIYTFIKKTLTTKTVNGKQTVSFTESTRPIEEKYSLVNMLAKNIIIPIISMVGLIIVFSLIGSKLFRAKSYYEQLPIEEGSVEEFNNTFNLESNDVLLPVIDKDLSFKLAQAKLGNYGSQFNIDNENFTLINVTKSTGNELVRIAPLDYVNPFVAISKKNEGSIGYIEVNVVTKEAKLVEVPGGLKYMPNAVFDKDLDRHIKMNYPIALYDDKNFEIDDLGNPYWVIPTYKKEIGVISGKNPSGVIIVNPVNGDISKFNLGEEPSWVDRACDYQILETQATNALKYKNGFFNSVFSKKEVFQLSDGYNYFIKGGDTYYVSCITSPNEGDQTSIGFVTLNLKTGKATKYLIGGITEMRAREIAMMDERVKAQNLEATWPILINYEGIPTYFLVLKNDVQDQKVVLINVLNGSYVAMGNTINEVKKEYDKLLTTSGNIETEELTLTNNVVKLRDLGETKELLIEGILDKYFVLDVNLSIDARFVEVSDNVTIKYKEYSNYNLITEIKINA